MDSYLRLTFGTSNGGSFSLTIPKAYAEISDTYVKSSMNKLITSGAIETKTGDLTTREGAVVYTVTKTGYILD